MLGVDHGATKALAKVSIKTMTKMFELHERISCAGCNVQVRGAIARKVDSLFATFEGTVGFKTDKSVQLLFPTKWQRAAFEKGATSLGVIFD